MATMDTAAGLSLPAKRELHIHDEYDGLASDDDDWDEDAEPSQPLWENRQVKQEVEEETPAEAACVEDSDKIELKIMLTASEPDEETPLELDVGEGDDDDDDDDDDAEYKPDDDGDDSEDVDDVAPAGGDGDAEKKVVKLDSKPVVPAASKGIKDLFCPACDFATAHRTDLRRHMLAKHDLLLKSAKRQVDRSKWHCCDHCKYKAFTEEALQRHLKRMHNGGGKGTEKAADVADANECKKCGKTFASAMNLRIHVKAVHLKTRDLKCESCTYATAYRSQLLQHMKAIHGIVVERKKILPAGGFHECKECSFRTKRADTLRMHVKTKHDKIRDHKCPQCPFSTANKRVLDAHVASRKHRLYWPDADGAYRCKFVPCEYTGTSYHKFLQHVMGVHMKHKEHQCPQCEFRSSYKGHIRVHLRQKHSEKVNVCDTCGFDAGSKQELRLHVRIEHEQRQVYSCDACDFSTVHSDSLIKHSKKTHGQTALVFACDACQFRCDTKDGVKYHKRREHSARSFDCQHCSFSAERPFALKKHMEKVHGQAVVRIPSRRWPAIRKTKEEEEEELSICSGEVKRDKSDGEERLTDPNNGRGCEERPVKKSAKCGGHLAVRMKLPTAVDRKCERPDRGRVRKAQQRTDPVRVAEKRLFQIARERTRGQNRQRRGKKPPKEVWEIKVEESDACA